MTVRNIVALLVCAALASCAKTPIEENRRLLEQGQPEAALAQLSTATRNDPRDVEVRTSYVRQRDQMINQVLVQAEGARLTGDSVQARTHYGRALELDPNNARARAGMADIDRDIRHALAMDAAEAAWKGKDIALAELRVREVLAENPQNRAARIFMRRVAEHHARVETTSPTITTALNRPITLEFRDAPLRSVFEVISRMSGLNFVFDKDVRSDIRATIFVRNTYFDDVIKLLTTTNQLDRRVMNENSVLIYPNTPAKQREYQDQVVRSFYLTNADAKQVLTMLRAMTKTRDMYMDDKLNMLVIKDTPDAIRMAEKLVAAQDLAEPEVMLEVEVLEIAASRLLELGVRYPERVSVGVPGTPDPVTGVSVPPAIIPLNATGLRAFIANPAAVLNLKQQDGTGNLLANPRIRVRNRDKARVHIGEKVPVITTTSTANVGVSSSVTYLDVGLKLEVEPTVYLDDEVAIKVGLEVSSILETLIDQNGTRSYRLGNRNAVTTLRLMDGETQVLAGLISDEDRVTANKIPGLGSLPMVGRLFSSNSTTKSKTEIVLLITPRVVRNLARPDNVSPTFYAGTDAAIGAPPLKLRATGSRTLGISSTSGAAEAPAAPAASGRPSGAGEPVQIVWSAPAQAAAGGEVSVSVGIAAGVGPRRVQFELVYDPTVLQVMGAPAPLAEKAAPPAPGIATFGASAPAAKPPAAPPAAAPDSGRYRVELARDDDSARLAQVRFRVLARSAVTTQIAVENASGEDVSQNPVQLGLPPVHSLTVKP